MVSKRMALNTSIDRDLAVVFRLLARLKYGDKKGAISLAMEEAVKSWCKDNKGLIKDDKDWLESLFGEDIDKALKEVLK